MIKRIQALDSVRLWCNFMVVSYHAYPAPAGYFASKNFDYYVMRYFLYNLGCIFLPTLFMISGWLMFRNFVLSRYHNKLYSRVKRLLIPYVCWNIVYIVLFYMIGCCSERAARKFDMFDVSSVWGVLRAILPFCGAPRIPDSSLWFVEALMLLALLSPIIYILLTFLNRYVFLAISVLPVMMVWVFPKFFSFYQYQPYTLSCFLIGALIAFNKQDLCKFFNKNKASWLIIGLGGGVTASFVCNLCGVCTDDSARGIRDVFMIISAPVLLALSENIHCLFNGDFVDKYIKPSAFFIYSGHVILTSILMHSLGGLGFHPVLIWLLTVIVTLSLMICIWNVWKRMSPKSLCVFDGTL